MGYENRNGADICDFGYCDEGMGATAAPRGTIRHGGTAYGSLRINIYLHKRWVTTRSRSAGDFVTVTGRQGPVYTGTAATLPYSLRLPTGSYTVTVTGIGKPRRSQTVRITPGRMTSVRFYV